MIFYSQLSPAKPPPKPMEAAGVWANTKRGFTNLDSANCWAITCGAHTIGFSSAR